MTIALTTPAQINMWVLLSRRSQLKLQMKGLKVPGIVKWCRENVPGAEKARTAKDCVVPLEYLIAENNGPQDFSIVNVHVMENIDGVFYDLGVFNDMKEVEDDPWMVSLYVGGNLELVFTLDETRPPNNKTYQPNN
jgi:hypothetical protein